MVKKVAYEDLLTCMNKDHVRHLGRYLDKVIVNCLITQKKCDNVS